jgi:predicted amidohydrolase
MPRKVRILGVQFSPEPGDKEANLDKVKNLIEENIWYKPDLIVLPEVFNSSVVHKYFQPLAENIPDGITSELFSDLSSRYSTNIVSGSFIEKCPDGKFRNTSVVFDRNGKIIGKYSKLHMFSYFGSKEGKYVTTGDSVAVVQTDFGKIGLSICYDLRFPELYRAMTYAGAELIVCPAAWPYPRIDHWLTLNKARAIENLAFMVSVNQCGKYEFGRANLGHSMVINPWGEVIASAGSDEGVMMTEIDIDMARQIRKEFPALNDRNLTAYGNLK